VTGVIELLWNGATLEARAGDTVAEALARSGIWAIAATRKRHRPLGLSGCFVQGVLADVDGTPNVRLDRIEARTGMRVTAQSTWPGPRLDLLQAARLIPEKCVRGGFEHPRSLPSGTWRFERWEKALSFLAGEGTLPAAFPGVTVVPGAKRKADAVVVGAGRSGKREAAALAASGKSVILISRSGDREGLPDQVVTLFAHEAFGVYRAGRLVAAAPFDPAMGATVIETAELVLATGKRSCPPVVPGNDLPGVMDAATALRLAARGVDIGRALVVGTGRESAVAAQLEKAGVSIAAAAPLAVLERIVGRSHVRAADIGRRVACEAVVHAGPWIGDPNLAFQACAQGELRLAAGPMPAHVRIVGSASAPDEPVHVCNLKDARLASICPCMDVMGAEILDLLAGGITHVEEIKRQTGCGMGPCQGLPCWELLRALLGRATSGRLGADRPSHRPPRAALTVAQAAGLADLVEPQQ
jgi:bacterioferritin-associated ferredoxin